MTDESVTLSDEKRAWRRGRSVIAAGAKIADKGTGTCSSCFWTGPPARRSAGQRRIDGIALGSEGGHTDVVELLLDRAADIVTQDIQRMTALHLATQGGHRDVVEPLLRRVADADSKGQMGTDRFYM